MLSIPSPPINGFHIGPLRVTFYGILIGLGVAAAWKITTTRFRVRGGDVAALETILTRMVVFGFLGARTAYVITHTSRFAGRWLHVFAIWEGGLALFGGLTVGGITAWVLARRKSLDLRTVLDCLAPAVPVAQAIGRWGNYVNQELFGTPSTLPWAVEIAPRYRPSAYPDSAAFHPTFLYESLWNLALAAAIIWLDRRHPSLRGRLIGVYFIGYGTIRFVLEQIRTDTVFRFLGQSRNAWVALGAILLGVAILTWRRLRSAQPAG